MSNAAMHPVAILQERYSLRIATNRDVPAIWRHIAAILGSYGIIADLETTDRDLTDIEAFYRNGTFYTLWEDERLIGTAAYTLTDARHAEIGRMYLSSTHRGKGLGRLLLARVTEAATQKGATVLSLKTSSALKEAIQLYTRSGFVMQERKPCGPCDVSMTKVLKDDR